MSPELETLDQLLGGPLRLTVIRQLFASDEHCRPALSRMLDEGLVVLARDNKPIPYRWEWQAVLRDSDGWPDVELQLTDAGAHYIS